MKQSIAIGLSIVVVYAAVILIGKRFRLSSRYERKPHSLNAWNSLDKGIDPTESDNS
ncbi:MAG: hypothetical protein WCJ89_00325 [Actinomycetes bacterium]